MKNLLLKLRKRLIFRLSLWVCLGPLLMSFSLFEESHDKKNPANASQTDSNNSAEMQPGYTINFNNVSFTEYLRFISRILNKNFVFEEGDLQFTVTIVSEEPVSAQNIMSTLIQVLRIHGLNLLEEGDNFLITKSKDVNQIPTIVSQDLPNSDMTRAPMITRVFRIKNANAATLVNILKPMMSTTALLEVSQETRQLIVTDIATNVEKIASLLASLDAPLSPLEIDTYVTVNVSPKDLITLTTQLVSPFADGNPLILVPQIETNTVFVVSTPYLIEKALSVMADLDIPSKVAAGALGTQNIYLYKIQKSGGSAILIQLEKLATNLSKEPNPPTPLITALMNAKYVKESNSILFISDETTLGKIKEIIGNLDAETIPTSNVFIYSVVHNNDQQLQDALNQMASKLKSSASPDENLIDTIETMQWIPTTSSLVFTGNQDSLQKIENFLKTLDSSSVSSMQNKASASEAHTVILYPLEHAQGDKVLANLKKVANHLNESSFPNTDLIQAIHDTKWVEEDNSLVLTGTKTAIEELKPIVARFDAEAMKPEKTSFFIYKPVNKPPKEIEKSLQELANDLEASGLADVELLETVASAKHIPLTNSILFTGTAPALQKLKELLMTLDVPSGESTKVQHVGALTFLIYKIKYVPANQLMASLNSFSADLQRSNSLDPELGQALGSMKWIKETNSLLFTGTQASLEKVEGLVQRFDLAELKPKTPAPPAPPTPVVSGTYALYKPHYRTGDELISMLSEFEQNLTNSGIKDTPLADTIANLKWIDTTSSILIPGDQASIAKVQDLLQKFDIPEKGATPNIEAFDNTSFLVYKLQYHKGKDISDALRKIALEFAKNPTPTNKNLIDAIHSIQWIPITNSLLVSGEQDILTRLRELISNLDVPLRQVFIEILVIETTLGNQQQFGLQWGGKFQYLNKVSAGTGNFPVVNPVTGTGGPNTTFQNGLNAINGTTGPTTAGIPLLQGFDLGVLGDIIMHKGKSFLSLGSLVNALETDNDATIVMNPKIITQDSNTSTIFVGQNLPYNSALTTIQGSGVATSQTSNIEYRDIGFNLNITPVLGNNDIVTLDINTDITSQINTPTSGQSNGQTFQVNGISTTHTSMSTKVHVPSDNFLVLSGMLHDTKKHYRSQIPCLGGLPVIGAIFSENDRDDAKDNIIIFVRPHIINTYEEYRQITERQQTLYKDEAVLPILKEEFDSGIDWVKTPTDEQRAASEGRSGTSTESCR